MSLTYTNKIKFPTSPKIGDSFVFQEVKYTWNGFAWDKINTYLISNDYFTRKIDSEIFRETPKGLTDGYNFVFELSKTPIKNSEHIFINGILQKLGEDNYYTLTGKMIYFIIPPYEGSLIKCTYSYESKTEIRNETPTKIDYQDNSFTIKNEPEIGTEFVYLNGVLQSYGNNYTINNNILTFFNDISTSERVTLDYFKKNEDI